MTRTAEEKAYAARVERARRIRTGRQPAERLCSRCGEPAVSSRHQYCARCRIWADAKHRRSSAERLHPKSPAERGYGATHVRARKRWASIVDAGGVACGHCGQLIAPGSRWDLSHPDDLKSLPPEPWHMSCNRRFAAAVTKRRKRLP
jgi:hypothetical protein